MQKIQTCGTDSRNNQRETDFDEDARSAGSDVVLSRLLSSLLRYFPTAFRADSGFNSPVNFPFLSKILPHPHNVPLSPALFLASPKKTGEKEGRRSARSRFFHEFRQWRRPAICDLRTNTTPRCFGAGRICVEKPPSSQSSARLDSARFDIFTILDDKARNLRPRHGCIRRGNPCGCPPFGCFRVPFVSLCLRVS